MKRRAHRLRYLLVGAALAVTLAGAGFGALEAHTAGSFGGGVWWALSLLTTVGFVGPAPVSTAGRLLAAALMIAGFGLLSLTAAALASFFVREDESPADRRDAAFESAALSELRALHERLDRLDRPVGAAPSDATPPSQHTPPQLTVRSRRSATVDESPQT